MDKKQTAVEILYRAVADRVVMQDETKALICIHISHDDLFKIHRQAKEIEKVRMESTWIAALDYAIELLKGLNNLESKDAFDQFYNETFGGGNK